jgi:K+-sensing histidine kinase KdpD
VDGKPLDRITMDFLTVDVIALDRRRLGVVAVDRRRMGVQPLDLESMDRTGVAVEHVGITPTRRSSIERRVVALIVLQLAIAASFATLGARSAMHFGDPRAVLLLTAAFALFGAFDMSLELRRHNFTFALTEAVLVVGFFAVGPIGLALAAAAGEGIDMLVQRRAPLKLAFNVANRLLAVTVAAVAFGAFGRTDVERPGAWFAALLASLLFCFFDVVSTSAVLSIVEHSRFHHVFVRSAATGVLATLASAPVGLLTLDLANHGPFTPLLLVPLAVAVALNSRYAVSQRDEHLRVERLYESLGRTLGLVAFDDALRAVATEARALGTGVAALCCAKDVNDAWIGAAVDDHGAVIVPSPALSAAIEIAKRGSSREIDLDAEPALQMLSFDAKSAVIVSAEHENSGHVVVAVLRAGTANTKATSRVETLGAFAHQAALLVSNARLHEQRTLALAREIDLNRQKSDFVAAVSHELRTPLGVMLGSVQTLERLQDRVTEAQRAQLFEMTIDQGARLQRLIDELLLVAAAEHADVSCDNEELDTAEVLGSIETTTEATTHGRLVSGPAHAKLVTDRSKLERILLNLVENAAKYAPDGPIELRVATANDSVHFSVVDHGPGIPAADRERVFERFVQLDQSSTRRQGGTGLGLHLCRQLAQVIAGQLTLTDTPGGGCTFTLTVPHVPAPTAVPAANARPGFLTRPERERVS